MTTAKKQTFAPDCKKVLQHRARLADLRKRYAFDDEAADRPCRFIENNVVQWKAPYAGKPLILSPWQRDEIIRPLFGFKSCPPDASPEEIAAAPRLFRQAYIQIPRKNGKTTLAAACLLYLLYVDCQGGEVYIGATKHDQAMIAFTDCKEFVEKSKKLKKLAKVYETRIRVPKTSSVLKPLSADTHGLDGLNVSAALIDELHAHQSRHVHDLIVTGTGSRDQPLVLKTTTAGEGTEGICRDEYVYSEKILEGVIVDDNYFCFIAEADEEIPWDDPAAFIQANPNYGISIKPDYLKSQLAKATNSPAYRKSYQRYHLNRWVSAGGSKWIPLEAWRKNAREFAPGAMAGRECFGGLDLASTTDLAAFSLVFPAGDLHHLLTWYFVPEDSIRDRAEVDKVPYDVWAEAGWIIATPGNVVDYDMVEETILQLRDTFNIRQIAFDQWNAVQVSQHLAAEGLDMVNFPQQLSYLHPASQEFERLVLGGNMLHNGNPVTTWCASNVKVKTDAFGKMKPVKASDGERIDGILATVMAVGAKLRAPAPQKMEVPPADFRRLLGA